MLVRGLHRRMIGVLLAAVLAGAAGGAIVVTRGAEAGPSSLACAALALVFLAWPASWMATWMVARPLRQLAAVAGDLQIGRLERRRDLPGGPGEVGEVGDALRAVADRLAKQLKDQRALMAAVSHELRSPLGRAKVLVELARDGRAPPSLADDLEAEIDAMDGLVGDLLAAARIDFEAVAPRDLDALDVARRAVEVAGLPDDVDVDVVGDAGTVRADATLLTRALSGLVANARQHGGRHVTVRVTLGERARFDVEDDGPGFAAGDEERAFEPFWRGPAPDGRPKPTGVGLGLALVRQIAEAHGGAAGAENRDGGGARVWVELPR